MQLNTYFLLVQSILSLYNFVNIQALIGSTIRYAEETEFPFVVSIVTMAGEVFEPSFDLMCGGALITTQDILTTDDCLKDKPLVQIEIHIGSIHLSQCAKYSAFWWVSFDIWALHKNLRVPIIGHNLSILRLSQNVTNIVPGILLPMEKNDLIGTLVQTASWALQIDDKIPKIMETTILQILPDNTCRDRINYFRGPSVTLDASILCTAVEPYILLGPGDQGAPILFGNKIVGVNKGVCPLVEPSIHPQKVNLHYNIGFYVPFIVDVVSNC